MSNDQMEDGEIPSENEPTPEPTFEEFNDEQLIDRIVQQENSSTHDSNRSASGDFGENNHFSRRNRSRSNRRSNAKFHNHDSSSRNMGTSWHNNGGGGQQIRPPPQESIVFGMQQSPMAPNQDIARLQSLVSNSMDYHQAIPQEPSFGSLPIHFFNTPPPPLMSLPFQRPPPMMPTYQPISPTPFATYRGGNYDSVSMELDETTSPAEPQMFQEAPARPPVQIPLEAVFAPPPPPPLLPRSTTEVISPSPPAAVVNEDEDALRAMLLSQLKQKKRTIENVRKSPQKNAKKIRTDQTVADGKTSEKITLSESVKNVFESQERVSAPPPAPRIEVKIMSTAQSLKENNSESPVPQSASTSTTTTAPSSREEKRNELHERMKTANARFEEEKKRVSGANQVSKKAIEMAKEAAEMAKKAEEMTKLANEMRMKSREDLENGKEILKKIIFEKREIQSAIEIMSIDDMDEIDDAEFPDIIVTTVKLESVKTPKKVSEDQKLLPAVPSLQMSDETENPQNQEVVLEEEKEYESSEPSIENNDSNAFGDVVDQSEKEQSGEDEYEEVEKNDSVPPSISTTSSETTSKSLLPLKPSQGITKSGLFESNLNAEQLLRERLLNKFSRTAQSPENVVPIVSSSSSEDRAEVCRTVLQKMCKFELNGRCERPRECTFSHLHDINDEKRQCQVLEGLFREVFQYNEADIEPAVKQVMQLLPEFREFEKMMDQFFKVVIHKTPGYKNRLFMFFANRRST